MDCLKRIKDLEARWHLAANYREQFTKLCLDLDEKRRKELVALTQRLIDGNFEGVAYSDIERVVDITLREVGVCKNGPGPCSGNGYHCDKCWIDYLKANIK